MSTSDTDSEEIKWHEMIFVNLAAIALWVGSTPTAASPDASKNLRAAECWKEARRLWNQRT